MIYVIGAVTGIDGRNRGAFEEVRLEAMAEHPLDVCECVGHTYINGTIFEMQVCARDELALRNGMRHLADLIDPTCHVIGTISQDWSDGSTVYTHELSCGHTCRTDWPEPPAFCDECGARVVSE